jgi:hypothetical protein
MPDSLLRRRVCERASYSASVREGCNWEIEQARARKSKIALIIGFSNVCLSGQSFPGDGMLQERLAYFLAR